MRCQEQDDRANAVKSLHLSSNSKDSLEVEKKYQVPFLQQQQQQHHIMKY